MTRLRLGELALNVEREGAGRPLLLLHGLTGSLRTWDPFLDRFGTVARTVAVDLIGHGDSDAPLEPSRYAMDRCVADLVELLDLLGLDRVAVLGYSMGGRIALQLAATRPERVEAVIVESGSPGLATSEERAARRASDEALAVAIELDGVAAFVDRWERMPLFAPQARLPEEQRAALRTQRLRNRPVGLANSLRGMGTGQQESLWDRLETLRAPALVVVGELDEKYREIGAQMVARLPAAALEVVPGAGHAVHVERPAELAKVVVRFLGATPSSGFEGV